MDSATDGTPALPGRELRQEAPAPAYLRRLPVVGPGQRLAGHLLPFDHPENPGTGAPPSWTQLHPDALFGNRWGVVPAAPQLLLDQTLEGRFPAQQTVLRLTETILGNETALQRCAQLRRLGFKFAAAAHLLRSAASPLGELAEIVTLDLASTSPEDAARIAWRFSRQPVTLLAEGVATAELHEQCRQFGYRYCQGRFITAPGAHQQGLLAGSKFDHLVLFRKVLQGADLPELEEAFRRTPELTYRLLRLVNSVSIGCTYRIESIRHALTILGQEQLLRWVLLSAFTSPEGWPQDSPLFSLVATRGKLMELTVQRLHPGAAGAAAGGSAFVTGILSLLHLSLGISPEELCHHLSLDGRIEAALLTRDGELGTLLTLAEMLDGNRRDTVRETVERLTFGVAELLPLQRAAFAWVDGIEQGL